MTFVQKNYSCRWKIEISFRTPWKQLVHYWNGNWSRGIECLQILLSNLWCSNSIYVNMIDFSRPFLFEILVSNSTLPELLFCFFFNFIWFFHLTAKLIAKVIIKPNYPEVAPVFSIRIDNGSKKYNAQNNNNVRVCLWLYFG